MRLDFESTVSTSAVSTISNVPTADTTQQLKSGIAAAQNGDRRTAKILLTRLTETDPQNVDAWLWLASISEYPEELLVFLDKVLAIDAQNERALSWEAATCSLLAKTQIERGSIAFEEGNATQAAQCFEKALEYDKSSVSAWLWKAQLAEKQVDMIECMEHVLALDPANEKAREAIDAASNANFEVKVLAVKALAATGEMDQAAVAIADLLVTEPSSIDLWVLNSHVLPSLEEKLDAYSRILEIEPANEFARYGHDFLGLLAVDTAPAAHEAIPNTQGAEKFEEFSFEANEAAVSESPVEEVSTEPITEMTFDVNEDQSDELENLPLAMDEAAQTNIEQPSIDYFDDVEHEIDTRETADGFPLIDERGSIEEARSLIAGQAALQTELYASQDAETREYRSEDTEFDGSVSQVNDNDFSIHETEVPNVQAIAAQPMEWEQVVEQESASVKPECPFCGAEKSAQAFDCSSCRAVLSFSDIETLLASAPIDTEGMTRSLARMKAETDKREFSVAEIQTLAVGHFNLKSYDVGFAYLQEAARNEPNNVILAGQLNAMAIRLDEIRRQNEVVDSQLKGKSILVVDDSATVRKLIANKLEKCGHVVSCAEDGVEAMTWIEQNKPDLVLLDIAMPRMDGYQVCKLIRSNEITKDVPVVMISGKDGFFDKVRGRMAGTTGYITKPFGPETLMRALETYLVEAPAFEPVVAE